jgi:hypothetical protein
MSTGRKLRHLLGGWFAHGSNFWRAMNLVPASCAGLDYASKHAGCQENEAQSGLNTQNIFWDFFAARKDGHGIWKWEHYFEIYHKHFLRLLHKPATILEIGVYSGGSLEMWKSCLAPGSRIIGVDIEQACKAYEETGTEIFIGDQADRSFWAEVKGQIGNIDIIIDDGGHKTRQQQITLEELLPVLNPGGVYLCEDIQGEHNEFFSFITGMASGMNCFPPGHSNSAMQLSYSFHLYPYAAVIEKRAFPLSALNAPRHGTMWQPFFSHESSLGMATETGQT